MKLRTGESAKGDQVTTEIDSPVMTVEEAGQLLGISRGLAFEAVRRGEIPSIRIGRRILVPRARLLALVEGDGPRLPEVA